MVLGFGRKRIERGNSSPWSTIDPRDSAVGTADDAQTSAANNWEEERDWDWFLESPPGPWEMEKPDESDDTDESDNRKVPFENLPEEVEEEESDVSRVPVESGAWTISVLCMGLGLIAACLIIPQADANRRLVYEREQLRLELTQVQKQAAVNKEFLAKMETDPQLTERLAQREMRDVEQGETIVNVKPDAATNQGVSASAKSMSPFTLVDVPPPPALEPYRPVGGVFSELCRSPQSHVYIMGFGMLLVACGLVLGGPAKTRDAIHSSPVAA